MCYLHFLKTIRIARSFNLFGGQFQRTAIYLKYPNKSLLHLPFFNSLIAYHNLSVWWTFTMTMTMTIACQIMYWNEMQCSSYNICEWGEWDMHNFFAYSFYLSHGGYFNIFAEICRGKSIFVPTPVMSHILFE